MGLKAYLHHSYQHCTEAQKAFWLTCGPVTFSFVLFSRAKIPSYQYPRSLVAQLPEDVYKNAGTSDVLLLVMKSLETHKVQAVHFLRAGRVRLTFQDSDTCSQVLKEGLDLGDVSV